jgi:hypothetical protein
MLSQFLLLLLALASPVEAFAQSVTVHWRVRFTSNDGRGYFSQPSPEYLRTLEACGHRPVLSRQVGLFPVSALRCRGVLDFNSSAKLRQRLENRIHAAERRGHKGARGLPLARLRAELARIDFSISPFGVFFSAQEGEGAARRIGINVAETRLVILNKPFWSQLESSPDADAFLLHEALGALNYEDTDYQRSNLIYELSKKDHVDGDEDGNTRVAAAERGGASVVGRGGDSNAQFFKASLLLLADKKLEVSGADARHIPTRAELRKIIEDTPVSIAPAHFFSGKNICDDPDTGTQSPLTCGGFVLKAQGGKPFLIITQDWAQFSEVDKRKLLVKIFRSIVTELVRDKQGR